MKDIGRLCSLCYYHLLSCLKILKREKRAGKDGSMVGYFCNFSKKLYRVFPLRVRHVYRKGSCRLRLRYTVMPSLFAVCLLTFAGWHYFSASDVASFHKKKILTSAILTEKGAVQLAQAEGAADRRGKQETIRYKDTLDLFRDESGQIRRTDTTRKTAALVQSYAMQFRNPSPKPEERMIEIGKGDTLAGVLQKAGASSAEAYKIVDSMKSYYDPRSIKPGQQVQVRFNRNEEGVRQLYEVAMALDPMKTVFVDRSDDAFRSRVAEKEVYRKIHAASTEIESSLFGSAQRAGIPMTVVANAMKAFSWNVDFQRDIRSGDKLALLYDNYMTDDGHVAKNGDVIFAKMVLSGKEIPIYRFEMEDGRVDYFQPDGQSVRKALLRTPVDGARVSSGFGMRKHPILGYSKMHKGMDFAARTGTPIYAAGDGVIEKAGRNGSYGIYARVRHNSKLKTAYAHMSKLANGMRPGKRVKQGQIIGYVGTTGRSTGPHLHYEVLVNDKQVNPRSVDLPTGEILKGKELKRLKEKIRKIDQKYAALSKGMKLAQAEDPKSVQ